MFMRTEKPSIDEVAWGTRMRDLGRTNANNLLDCLTSECGLRQITSLENTCLLCPFFSSLNCLAAGDKPSLDIS